MLIHQSDLASMNRCGEQHRRQLAGEGRKQLSATAYGSVMHHALHTLERTRDLELALSTFEHYWHPLNIEAICEPVDVWIGRQTYGGLAAKGVDMIRKYWDLRQYEEQEELLALEIPFVIPIPGTEHHLAGTIDRLAIRRYARQPHLCIDDWKTGRKKSYLKFNLQHIAYAWATTQPEFWLGNPEHFTEGFGSHGHAYLAEYADLPRKGYWIDLSGNSPKWNDCGVKDDQAYQRFFRGVENYVAMREHNIFPLAIEGEVCEFCPFNNDCPGGTS